MKDIFQELTPKQRLRYLEDNALDIVENYRHTRPLTEEELNEERETHANLCIEIEAIQAEMKRVADEFKEKLKPLNVQRLETLSRIRSQQLEEVTTAYLIQDFDEFKVGTYNADGVLLSERKMREGERQAGLFRLNKVEERFSRSGTDD